MKRKSCNETFNVKCAQVDEAEALKLKGNQAYGSGDYSAAIVGISSKHP